MNAPTTGTDVTHDELANSIRALAMDSVEKANSGHPGMPMGMTDIATVLFTKHLKFDPADPHWPDRDRFVLSNGHGSMLLYSLLHLTGYPQMTIEELQNFRQLGHRTAGHPEYGHADGIETTTGPLGQGLATAVGMALAERLLAAEFGPDMVDHHTYVFAGDGCLMEGISHEACSLAGHLKLNKLIVLYDDNGISIDGSTTLAFTDDVVERFNAYGWAAVRIDGHNPEQIDRAITEAKSSDRPTLIACRTIIGKGAPTKAGSEKSHGAALGKDEIAGWRKAAHWNYGPWEIPEKIYTAWRTPVSRNKQIHEEWAQRLAKLDAAKKAEFDRRIGGKLPDGVGEAVKDYVARLKAEKPKWATRKASQEALKVLTAAIPEMIGGSADLTHSNLTNTPSTPPLELPSFHGRYVSYGVREFGMVAAMNGMTLHGGVIPYGGTFFIFTDYARPAIRLAALMGIRTIVVATHDSIGLGEDGPTHQPVEHLASFRAMPNILMFRPGDAVETAECWQIALEAHDRPSILALSRQEVPTLRTEEGSENLSRKGAYVIYGKKDERDLTILATGTEVTIAIEGAKILERKGLKVAVVSMPCFELFEQQDKDYRKKVLGKAPRMAVEAASPYGWTRYVESEKDVIGMRTFGASAPLDKVYKHFGITPEAVAERGLKLAKG
jgi:transketolase